MTRKTPLLVIGRLFGSTTNQLRERFDLTEVDDFDAIRDEEVGAARLRAIALGMIGTGHPTELSLDGAFFDRFPRLELFACLGAGCEFIDLEAAIARNVTVTNTPGANTEETADTAMGLLLGVVRQLPQADRYLRAGRWPSGMFPLTGTLRNKRLGVLGLGRIGKAIARRSEAFGLDVLYHGRTEQDVPYRYYRSALELARDSDILMVVVPGGDATRGMVDAAVLRALGSEGILVNVSRGTVVDEAALVAALREGIIRSAAIDAFQHEPHPPEELIEMEHVVLTPHIGSGTHYTREQMSQKVVDNLIEWDAGRPVLTPMDPVKNP